MRISRMLFIVLVATCVSCGNHGYVPNGTYKLIWSEEFNGDSLSSRKWRITQQGANFNNEDQAYLKEQVRFRDGLLVLKCEKQHWDGPSGRSDIRGSVSREYISGEINTRESWKFARIEVRAKVPPRNKGILSAFWMTPADRSWPPEIDIAEILGSHVDTAVFTNHWGTPENRTFNASSYRNDDLSTAFHIYSVEWDETEIRWYLDGVQRAKSTKGVPAIPMIVRISLPVGPDWEGNPDATSVFPQELLVDWVRVYSRS
ncbi:MAG TPA: glycoside hydrolase family 16 protein [Steroidobacteraceae bacterium]|nr:glycoside hydrolase family 16 protein [Steroidobacteraceae bacterium]